MDLGLARQPDERLSPSRECRGEQAGEPQLRLEAALSFMAALATVHLALWLAIVSLRLAVDADLHPSDAVLAFLIAVAGCILAGRSQAAIRATAIIGSALLLATWGVALIYAAALDSLSYDGQTYHALAIRHLRDGWNPFRDQLTPNVPPMTWLNHYPKASWIWATGIEAMVGSYQAGKATNLVLAIAAGAAVFSAASAVVHAPKWACFLFGALAAANPVASVQMAEYYVDGLLGSLLTIMAAGALIWTRRQSPLALLMICAAAICLVNVKFTGLVYALLLGSVVFAVSLLRRRTRLAGALPVLACLLAVVGPGYNPYVTNMLDGDHIFHPVMGDRQIDILGISDSTPSPLDGYPAAAQLALSLASETANSCRKCDPGRLKPPFVVRESEIRGATIPDPRTGGFGPLFSAALLLAAILLVVSMRAGAASMTLGISLVVLVGLVMVNPAAWWARYVPHLWLIPLTIAAFLHRAELGPIGRVARIALLVVLVANAGFMAVIASGYAAYSTLEARAQVANLARSGPVYVAASPWAGALQRLHDGGVAVAEREFGQPDCQEVVTVLRSDLDVCVPVAP